MRPVYEMAVVVNINLPINAMALSAWLFAFSVVEDNTLVVRNRRGLEQGRKVM